MQVNTIGATYFSPQTKVKHKLAENLFFGQDEKPVHSEEQTRSLRRASFWTMLTLLISLSPIIGISTYVSSARASIRSEAMELQKQGLLTQKQLDAAKVPSKNKYARGEMVFDYSELKNLIEKTKK